MKLAEALICLTENYIDLKRYGWDIFVDEMENRHGHLSDDRLEILFKQYVKSFWRISDRGIKHQGMNVDNWASRMRSKPSEMIEWIQFIDHNS